LTLVQEVFAMTGVAYRRQLLRVLSLVLLIAVVLVHRAG